MKRIIILAMASFSLVSCNKFLTQVPISSSVAENFWSSPNDVAAAKATMYASLATALSSNYIYWGEVRGGSYGGYENHGTSQTELITHNIPITHETAKWTDLYATINKANLILKYVPQMSTVDKRALGEAYAIRALAYFWIVRIWGDAPIFTEAIEEYDVNTCLRRRMPKEDVFALIESDLEKAVKYFPEYNTTSTDEVQRYYMSLAGVYALQLDVYAWKHEYQRVIDLWETKITNLPIDKFAFKKFVSSDQETETIFKWRSIFLDNTEDKEVFFSVRYDKLADAKENGLRKMFTGNSRNLAIRTETLNDFEGGDIRKQGSFYFNGYSTYYLEKFWDFGESLKTSDPSDNDLIMYRYTDLLLLYAEALVACNRKEDAVTQLNLVRRRAGVIELDGSKMSSEDAANAVLKERHLELLFEGKYWFDLVRTGNIALAKCPANKVLWPIHTTHIAENPNIEQNIFE